MAGTEEAAAIKKERQRDKRLQDNYRWSLERRNRLSEHQGKKCAICGRPENPEHPLNLDHEHFKIHTQRLGKNWHGFVVFKDKSCTPVMVAKTKKALIEGIKNAALPLSVRGLLCPGRRGCNRRLGWVDDLVFLEAAIRYLKNPPAKQIFP